MNNKSFSITSIILFLSLIMNATASTAEPVLIAAAVQSKPAATAADAEEDFTESEEEDIEISDPFESFNRVMFNVNDKIYFGFLKPVAKGMRIVVPEKARVSLSHFFSNILSPVRIVNAGLQLKGEDASNEFFRMIINSTIGLLGFFDVAKTDFGINIKKEDFGQTLGHYGVGNGPYLVLPLLGPSSVRDGIGLLVDGKYLDPASYEFDGETGRYVAFKWLDIETTLSIDKDTYEAIKNDSIDPYVFLRNAYIQFRQGAVDK